MIELLKQYDPDVQKQVMQCIASQKCYNFKSLFLASGTGRHNKNYTTLMIIDNTITMFVHAYSLSNNNEEKSRILAIIADYINVIEFFENDLLRIKKTKRDAFGLKCYSALRQYNIDTINKLINYYTAQVLSFSQ